MANLKADFGAVMDGVTDDSVALANALTTCGANNQVLVIPEGVCYAPTITRPTISGRLRIVGQGKGVSTIRGDQSKIMVGFSGGASLSARDIGFDGWATPFLLLANTGGSAFDIISAVDCLFTNIAVSPISDAGQYANGGISELRFERNTVVNCGKTNGVSAGLRLDSNAIYSAFVRDNEIRDIGGNYSGQKDGISLGAVSKSPLSSLVISGNRIYNVGNNSADHTSGITAFGRHVRITDNSVNTVQSLSSSNIDQYAIYTKASYSIVRGNACVDAGGNAACIMTKGMPNDGQDTATDYGNVIADNTILIQNRWASIESYTGITTYNGGMNIHDNIIEGTSNGIVEIAPIYAAVSGNCIHHNKIRNLIGTATKPVRGVQTSNPTFTTIDSNLISDVGSGIEPGAYGIVMQNVGSGSYGPIVLKDNHIRNLSSADTNQTRGIALNFIDGQTFSGFVVEGNIIANSSRGIRCSFLGTLSGGMVKGNLFANCSLSTFDYSGATPLTTSNLSTATDVSVWSIK